MKKNELEKISNSIKKFCQDTVGFIECYFFNKNGKEAVERANYFMRKTDVQHKLITPIFVVVIKKQDNVDQDLQNTQEFLNFLYEEFKTYHIKGIGKDKYPYETIEVTDAIFVGYGSLSVQLGNRNMMEDRFERMSLKSVDGLKHPETGESINAQLYV